MKRILLLAAFLLICILMVFAWGTTIAAPLSVPKAEPLQDAVTCTTYNGAGGTIPDNNLVGLYSPVTVTTVGYVQAITVTISISHDYPSDLIGKLCRPNGCFTYLFQNDLGMDYGSSTWSLNDDAVNPISYAYDPFEPSYYPNEPMVTMNMRSRGIWRLNMIDNYAVDEGTLDSWSLEICTTASPQATFTPSITPTASETSLPSVTPTSSLTPVASATPVPTAVLSPTPENDIIKVCGYTTGWTNAGSRCPTDPNAYNCVDVNSGAAVGETFSLDQNCGPGWICITGLQQQICVWGNHDVYGTLNASGSGLGANGLAQLLRPPYPAEDINHEPSIEGKCGVYNTYQGSWSESLPFTVTARSGIGMGDPTCSAIPWGYPVSLGWWNYEAFSAACSRTDVFTESHTDIEGISEGPATVCPTPVANPSITPTPTSTLTPRPTVIPHCTPQASGHWWIW